MKYLHSIKRQCKKLLFLFCILLNVNAEAQTLRPAVREIVSQPLSGTQFELYLLIGQSNMAGRGILEPVDILPDRHVLRLNKEMKWEVAKDPLHFDKPAAAVGPGFTFGKDLAQIDTSKIIGLIPSAVGGTPIAAWHAGVYYEPTKTYPYDDAIKRAREAMKQGTLKGVIWDQGESDSNVKNSAVYGVRLKELIENLRSDLGIPDLAFVAAQLPDYQIHKIDTAGNERINHGVEVINKAIADLEIKNYAFIDAKDVKDIGDHTHLDAPSARLMGHRYANAMQKLVHK
ncbi:putative acetyl xylan esterase AxeA [Arcticibacter svalbardensis MN12-7]|uniref:Putative acetyl xylan esterase AxeA n=1 Tax=Arcticibacter svalbardensis MN12-7 TaxID=1150600 RepID=R9GR37_9SPHI|nr:sialate O-acetylesterase [Arcticibacter svalbardensis]EOR94307.1 putative acetyl xylan esterase AxeA [Arcticibacter svalbardensis MN12-7]